MSEVPARLTAALADRYRIELGVGGNRSPAYDISPDDRRFLMPRVYEGHEEDAPNTILIDNFFEELSARVPR